MPYTFYTILTYNERKNPIGLLKAYLTEFRRDENVLLKIVTPSWNHGESDGIVKASGLDSLPKWEILGENDKWLSERDYRKLHRRSDCYVSASRGEGWGLGSFEAALMGNPIIVPDFGGHLEYLQHYTNKTLIPCFKTPAIYPEMISDTRLSIGGVSVRPIARNAHEGSSGDQLWAEPDLSALMVAMREHFSRKLRKIPEAATELSRFSRGSVGIQFKKLLEAL
jgi:glycosyltransferase involved in cell wall biosynthesis